MISFTAINQRSSSRFYSNQRNMIVLVMIILLCLSATNASGLRSAKKNSDTSIREIVIDSNTTVGKDINNTELIINPLARELVGSRTIKNPKRYSSYAISASLMRCGGTLIAPDMLLTAAHCQGHFKEGIYIGSDSYDGSGGEFMSVAYEIPHPEYVKVIDRNDIMIVRLKKASKAPVQKLNFDTKVGSKADRVKMIGYSATELRFLVAQKFMEVNVKIIDFNTCYKLWNKFDLSKINNICAGDLTGKTSGCDGDAGGPLLNENDEQIGVLSYSKGCSMANTPTVYTRIAGYKTFIQDTVCNHSTKKPLFCK